MDSMVIWRTLTPLLNRKKRSLHLLNYICEAEAQVFAIPKFKFIAFQIPDYFFFVLIFCWLLIK